MKKSLILTLGLFFALVGMMSCGDGKDAAREQAIRDSLQKDSLAKVALADSLRNDSILQAQAAQALLDSLRQDSINQANKKGEPFEFTLLLISVFLFAFDGVFTATGCG